MKFVLKMLGFVLAASLIGGMLSSISMASAAAAEPRTNAKSEAPAPARSSQPETIVIRGGEVLKAHVAFKAKVYKQKGCDAYAEKIERPAPPRDPQALCKGKLLVKISGELQTPTCPQGYFGGTGKVKVMLRQMIKARAFAKSIATGRVQTWASIRIKDRALVRGWAKSTCVRVPPPHNPPPHDECPDVPGDQPPGHECPPPPPPEEEVTGSVVCKNPPHLYVPNGNGIMVCEVSQSNGVKPTLSQFGVMPTNDRAYFAQPTEFGHREEAQVNPCPSNVLCVRVQVWAVSPGLFTYRYRYMNQSWVNGQFMIEEDDFRRK